MRVPALCSEPRMGMHGLGRDYRTGWPAQAPRCLQSLPDRHRRIPMVSVLETRRTDRQTGEMTPLKHSEAIVIARSPEDLYDLVSDITRMGTWSPVCKACWWDEGAGPEVGRGSLDETSYPSELGRRDRRSSPPTEVESSHSSSMAPGPGGDMFSRPSMAGRS